MEHEICRRETHRKFPPICKYLAFLSIVLAAIALIFVFVFASANNDWHLLFNFGWAYVYIIFVAIFLVILAIILFYVKEISSITTTLVLTNKRIYSEIKTSRRVENQSYNLNKITSYGFERITTKWSTYFIFEFKLSSASVKFVVDDDFYNMFVEAVNNTISVTE